MRRMLRRAARVLVNEMVELLSPRLRLRRLRQGDAAAVCAYRALPEVARFQSWESYALADAAELIAASRGLGFLLIDAQNTGRADIILLSIALLALIGKVTDWLLQRGERRFLRWADTFAGAK